MTKNKEKKPLLITYSMMPDLMLSMIFFLTWSTIQLMGTFYLLFIHVGPVMKWTPVVLVVTYLFIRRLRIGNFLMLTLHFIAGIIFIAATYKASGNDIGILVHMFFSVVGNFVYSMSLRYKIKDNNLDRVEYDTLIIAAIVHAIAFVFLGLRKEPENITAVTISVVLCAMFYFAARQLTVFENNYYHNLHSSTQPVGTIRRQNYVTIAIVMGGIIFALVLLRTIPVEKITSFLIAVIAFIVKWILSRSPDADPVEEDGRDSFDPDEFLPEPVDVSPLAQFIMNALATIIIVGVALAAFYLIIVWIRNLFRNFSHAEDHETVTGDNAITDIVESVKPKALRGRHRIDFGKGSEREIRKKFFLKMRKGIASGLPIGPSSTAREVRDILKAHGDAQIEDLTQRYEKIRYDKRNG